MEMTATRKLLLLLNHEPASEARLIEIAYSQLEKSVEQQILRRLDAYDFSRNEDKQIKEQLKSFTYDSNSLQGLYQSHERLRQLIHQCRVPFKELAIGKLMRFGRYLNSPLLWRIIHVEESGKVLLLSERIIGFKAFSASSEAFPFGVNQWNESALRRWLNAEQKNPFQKIEVKPNKERVWQGIHPFSSEPGFLSESNFSTQERNAISVDSNDDRVRFLKEEELNLFLRYRGWDCTAKPTDQAVENCSFGSDRLLVERTWGYFLPEPLDHSNHAVRTVTVSGELGQAYAYCQRPF